MARTQPHKWVFKARFRRNAFGWRTQPAIKRIREAVSEIKKVRRRDKDLAAEGAVAFLRRLSPALERIDSSSGAIGTAVNNAITALVPVIAEATADASTRGAWMEQLWDAYQEDQMPYIELLGDSWGELCGSREVASSWADRLLETCKLAWSPDPRLRGYFKGTSCCLSALLAAGRYGEILELLEMEPHGWWTYRVYGVKALAAMGKRAEALRYANEGRGRDDAPAEIAGTCEEVLLASGFVDEAYRRYGLQANRRATYTAWFRAVARKYPAKEPREILEDLARSTPGEEGKWFAAAKGAGLLKEAIVLANRSPCSPQTLTRAARDFAERDPSFAIEAGVAALRWIVAGYGYEISSEHVVNAYARTMAAAANDGREDETWQRLRELVAQESFGDSFVTQILGTQLRLGSPPGQ